MNTTASAAEPRTPSTFSLWAPVAAYMAVIFALSSLSKAPLPEGMSDTSGHGIGYFGFAVVILRAWAGGLSRRIGIRHVLLTMTVAILYGISDELHQSFVPGRTCDIHDLYADSVGAAIGVAAGWAWGIIAGPSDV